MVTTRAVARKKIMTEAMSMLKFSSQVFNRLLNEKNDRGSEKNDLGKRLGLPHTCTGYGPDD